MHHRWNPNRLTSGFVLLHSLWVLLAASALILGILQLGLRSAEDVAVWERNLKLDLALESAIDWVIYDLVSKKKNSRWLNNTVTTAEIQLDEHRFLVTVQPTDGLLDVNAGDPWLLSRLFHYVTKGSAKHQLSQLLDHRTKHPKGTRPIPTYPDLQAILQIDDRTFTCLYPHVTLFSNLSEPLRNAMDRRLARILQMGRLETAERSVIETTSSTISRSYRITVRNTSLPDKGQSFSVEILLTGLLEPSYLVRSRMHISKADNAYCP